VSLLDRVDALLERGADALDSWARDLTREDGFKRQIGEELHDDADFLRRLAPTKIVTRARGETPVEDHVSPPAATAVAEGEPPAPAQQRPLPPALEQAKRGGGVNPWVVVGAAFVAGVALAKIIDWRGHAHPRG
jgi:hypothetical protein